MTKKFGLLILATLIFGLALAATTSGIAHSAIPEPDPLPIDQLITAAKIYKHDLAILDLKTLEITPLTDDATIEQEPTWSPDGKSILYSAIDNAWHELRLLSLETGEKKTLLKEEGVSFTGPDWSPENRVVFTVRDQFNHKIELGTGDITESGVHNVTKMEINAWDPVWGNDNRIYFSGITEIYGYPELASPNKFISKLEVHSLSAADTNGSTDAPFVILQDYASCQPSFSHDGEKIAFGAHRLGFNDLYIHDIKDNKIIQVSNNKFEDRDPVWSPTSNELYYVSDRNGAFQLFKANKRGKESQVTENLEYDIRNPEVSPDGKKVAFKTITPIVPDTSKTLNQERDIYFRGISRTSNFTEFMPQQSFRQWVKPLLIGTLNLGTHGELIYSGMPRGDTLAAYRFDEMVEVYENASGFEHKFCTIKNNGDVLIDQSVLKNFRLDIDKIPVYEKWQYFKEGKPVIPSQKVIILPEMPEKYALATDADTWAIKLSDGSWYACSKDMRPFANAILFYLGESGDMWIRRDVDGKGTIDIAHVLQDRSVEILESPEKNNLKVKEWPYAIAMGSPLPPGNGERYAPIYEKYEWVMPPIGAYDRASNTFINPFRKGKK